MGQGGPAPRVIAFNSRYQYPAARKCIYCGSRGGPGQKLGEEHIIPLSFGGNLILPLASCRPCERITTAVEDHCVKGMISTARPHLGIRGRQQRRSLSRGPVYVDQGHRIETRSALLSDHPGAILMPILGYPAALVDAALPTVDREVEMRLAVKAMTPDIAVRARKFAGRVTLTRGLSAILFYRFVAKIAHAFTAAELGIDNFAPFLLNLIRGQPPMHADHFVGSGGGIFDPPVPHLHELSFVPQPSDLIVVRLRLFASLDMPTHFAVVGTRRVLNGPAT